MTIHAHARWVLVCAGLILGHTPLCADVVKLANGRAIDGIVIEESSAEIRVQVAWRGFVMLDRPEVVEIVRTDEAAHEDLRAQWHAQYAQDQQHKRTRLQQAEAARRAEEAAMRRLAQQPSPSRSSSGVPFYPQPPVQRWRTPPGREAVIVGRTQPARPASRSRSRS